uniref:Uncharacterized protein n=1 Tax=viral metagenome TaxID=1070528 RepID=A0A6H2A748_9ZZZZ
MKPEEAITVLHEDLGADVYDNHPYFYQAQKLGIEALKIILRCRNDEDINLDNPLPGERTD